MRTPRCLGLFCFLALLNGVLAAPFIWCNPNDRRRFMLRHENHRLINYIIVYLHLHLIRMRQHIGDAIDDIDSVLNGQHALLSGQLTELLEDDTVQRRKTMKIKQHLILAHWILHQGFSQEGDLDTWLNSGAANGGVVSFLPTSY